jgi:hypothetical protein
LAYAAAAILIGFAVMMLPLALETGPQTYEPTPQPNFAGEQRDQIDNQYGLTSPPYNITSSSLILLTGLIIAFTAYILVKRQLNQQPTTFSS